MFPIALRHVLAADCAPIVIAAGALRAGRFLYRCVWTRLSMARCNVPTTNDAAVVAARTVLCHCTSPISK